ncbi:choice-of-anchor K domain-containing protein [Sphingomonas nostoxanthinifaciens]|uniref:choice-of-anchor K domain-containing protein n=1 Tax=Sphingomonas nostoxanthinifaciens TaxID=2872652 RepID=UPI001CC21DE5|nr:choice-of-anchor K domain-containing protein [Sphingomonas nostoxanthinifaciens]
MKRFFDMAICLTLVGATAPALAAGVTGSTSAIFVNPKPGTAVVTGVGTSHFTYGDPIGFSTPNELSFASAAFSSDYETPFKVGTLTYTNGSIAGGTEAASVDVALTLAFATPAIPAVASIFTLDLVNTPNTSDPIASADYVYFPSSYSATDFVIGGTTYHVALTGFGNVVGDGFLASDSSELHVLEGASATADLFAVVTSHAPGAVPEPASWAMFIGGFALVGGAMRDRRRMQAIA